MRFRGKSIRRKIVALLLVPLISLTALWGFATYLTGREANQLMGASTIVEKVGHPLEDTVRVVQKERRQTLVFLADPRASDALPLLRRERAATDRVVADVKKSAQQKSVRDALSTDAEAQLNSILSAVEGLGALRDSVEKRTIDRNQALDFYNGLIDPCYRFLTGLHTMEDVVLDKQLRALVGVSRARELLSREDALVASALVAGRLDAPELRQISDLVANRKLLVEINSEALPAAERRRVEQYWASPESEPLRTAENKIVAAGPTDDPRAVDAERWQEVAPPVLDRLANDSTEMNNRFQDRGRPAGYSVLIKAGVAGVLGFLALLVSVFVSVRIGRELVRDLSRLRKDAHEVSGVRLPSVMRRLAAGEHVDVETEAPHLRYEKDEIGQVGQALNTLQRAAVEAAVKQADMRRGVSEVFVNLARRNQVLLHRQLTLLDAMERRTENTDELADLFRLDHLTTRMRRHAEGLVILSGAAPSRQWRKPIQLMDVVRAAVAEVEDYERIEVRRLPRLGVGGPAVADLTHLIAELLENATVFSPPHTAVQVHGERVANGFTLEIHDRGLGMPPEALLDANLRLAETPEFELSDTDRLGLFVVSRLAQRQNVRVSLQTSPYGGTTAVVFIPAALLTDAVDTHGSGFRLDRRAEKAIGSGRTGKEGPRSDKNRRDGAADRRTADRPGESRPGVLAPVPSGLAEPTVLDGPVELEGPVDALGFMSDPVLDSVLGPVLDGVSDIEDTESERGGIFRARDLRRDADREQHQQASDQISGSTADVRAMRSGGPVPLPRRKSPTLVTDRGRHIDDAGRAHPTTTGQEPADTGRDSGAPSYDNDRSSSAPGQSTSDAWASAAVTGRPTEPRQPTGFRTSTEPAAPTSAPPEATPPPAPSSHPGTVGGLPRRIRQANLAPQLRETSGGRASEPARGEPAEDIERDADEVRSRMASLQRGWQRGRRQNAEEATGPGETAQGTTPGGDGR
ncbi:MULTISPECIES: nitrate- and nitrite sensing domain-containing protein [unclassified Streptomyces]|uniref:sensor histidine kinase n=1 Tax=unclassified Streptomyces TaxID=2593676 RepID=UPI002251DF92|nr:MULTISPECIES: nitrate- and nitrite sensing domain-containing protein [unclassified Streptomyces]MCX4536445.1 nitrate- and nitrite sensing domain-containing protein [Streptomyces sp. NBC_01669]WRZ98318.1 nitrate- and nitrite sensing domain-containing protein [Streptomyces sp. NBC_00841]